MLLHVSFFDVVLILLRVCLHIVLPYEANKLHITYYYSNQLRCDAGCCYYRGQVVCVDVFILRCFILFISHEIGLATNNSKGTDKLYLNSTCT